MTSYQQAAERLLALGHELHLTPTHKFELRYIRVLLEALGNPQRRFPSVLIAGTNGKGSTAATLAAILTAAGHKTALYTSPHLVRVNERLRINGDTIPDEEFARAWEAVEEAATKLLGSGALPWHPSFFETLTAMAFLYFAQEAVEVAVLEVGMGGRLDATNVVEPALTVITDIALDHQKFLGDTIAEIAAEKAGILRAGVPVVTLPQHPEANDVVGKAIQERGARAVSAVKYVPPVSPGAELVTGPQPAGRNRYPLEVMGEEIVVDSPLPGRHQLRNLALAIAAAEELNAQGIAITAKQVEQGVRETRWPGRFQVTAAHDAWPEMVLDVAHNPAGAWALRAALSERIGERRLVFLFGAMRDKAIQEMAEILFPLAERVIATRPDNPRAAAPEEIREAAARTGAEVELEPDVAKALERARERARNGGIVVVTGSIYLVGAVLGMLGESGRPRNL
jgi:dihydrofolate synthase/folylpolyglutamate synthase